MSSRAIAPVVGASFKTVARDIESVSVDTDAPRTVKSLDAHGLHLIPQLCGIRLGIAAAKVPNGPIVSAPTWAALATLSEPDICPDRPRTYTGGTLPDQHPRP